MGSVVYPTFRTRVDVGELVTVSGWLPGMAWPPAGAIAVSGDMSFLSRGRARELAGALVLVAARMDVLADERYGTITAAASTGGRAG